MRTIHSACVDMMIAEGRVAHTSALKPVLCEFHEMEAGITEDLSYCANSCVGSWILCRIDGMPLLEFP